MLTWSRADCVKQKEALTQHSKPDSPKVALKRGLSPLISAKVILIYNGIREARIMLFMLYVHHCGDKKPHVSDQAA